MGVKKLGRDLRIYDLRRRGLTYRALKKRFGLKSRQHAHVICKKMDEWKRKIDDPNSLIILRGLPYNILKKVLDSNNPTLPDLRRWIESTPEWKKLLLRVDQCGQATVQKIEEFARDHGIRVD